MHRTDTTCRPLTLGAILLTLSLGLIGLVGASTAEARSAKAQVSFTARGSVEQVDVTGAQPGATLRPARPQGPQGPLPAGGRPRRASCTATCRPATGYRVRQAARRRVADRSRSSRPLRAAEHQALRPDASPPSGYGYLTTRDGTKLAIDVRLPRPATGPVPDADRVLGLRLRRPGRRRERRSRRSRNLLGFAVVDVNMRGTGCSGGAFDYFEPLQGLDGYDVIETVARQPWVLHHKVGMMGISYGGISQLFVGATQPPHLAAITPLSVIDNTADDALSRRHPQHRLRAVVGQGPRARRAAGVADRRPGVGATSASSGGDTDCKANQALHAEAVDLLAKIDANHYYVPKVADPLAPVTFVHKINVPVFLACQWTDEQTGGHCPTLADALHRHEPQVVHVHQRHAHRLARPGDVQPLVRLPRALRRAAEAPTLSPARQGARAGGLPDGDGRRPA